MCFCPCIFFAFFYTYTFICSTFGLSLKYTSLSLLLMFSSMFVERLLWRYPLYGCHWFYIESESERWREREKVLSVRLILSNKLRAGGFFLLISLLLSGLRFFILFSPISRSFFFFYSFDQVHHQSSWLHYQSNERRTRLHKLHSFCHIMKKKSSSLVLCVCVFLWMNNSFFSSCTLHFDIICWPIATDSSLFVNWIKRQIKWLSFSSLSLSLCVFSFSGRSFVEITLFFFYLMQVEKTTSAQNRGKLAAKRKSKIKSLILLLC